MDSWKRRIVYALATVTTVVLVYAVGSQWAMAAFEHKSVSYLQSVQVVVESITTAGFGGHAPWASTVMNVFVLGVNLTGVVFVFLAVPVFLVPLFREVLRTHPPSSTAKSGHIIVCNHSPRGEVFVAELTSRGRDYVFIEPDRAAATALHDAGYNVIVGDPESPSVLENANISTAAGVVADAADDTNASIALTVRELNPDVRVVTLVEDPASEQSHRLAGADVVLSPRQLLGESLARQVPTVTTTLIDEGMELDGHTLEEAAVRTQTGATVLAVVWGDDTITDPDPESFRFAEGDDVLIAGTSGSVRRFEAEYLG